MLQITAAGLQVQLKPIIEGLIETGIARDNIKAKWVATEEEADAALHFISRWPVVGFDTEFYNVDILTQSCVARSIVDVFSLATPSAGLSPLGFEKPESWVFDGRLLSYGPVKSFLQNPEVVKPIHNQPVDSHSVFNHGVALSGGVNTLSMARWIYPERAALVRGNFDIDSLCKWRIGYGKSEDFDDLFGYDDYEAYEIPVEANFCLGCESFGCAKKKPPHFKERRTKVATRRKKVRRHIQLSEVRPGHPLWDRYRKYAAVDAELALILFQLMLVDGQVEREYPYGAIYI